MGEILEFSSCQNHQKLTQFEVILLDLVFLSTSLKKKKLDSHVDGRRENTSHPLSLYYVNIPLESTSKVIILVLL